MFSVIKSFIKTTFIAYYKEDKYFYVQKIIVKRDKIIEKDNRTFENEKEFLDFINISLMENTQTYIATIIMNYNQGCIDSCSHTRYKEFEINIENVKILCIKNQFSIFIGLLEFQEFKKKTQKYSVDLIYSPYLIIENNKEETKNTLYALITKENIVLSIYKEKFPLYSSIYEFKKEETKNREEYQEDNNSIFEEEIPIDDVEEIDDIEEIENLDDLENLDKDLDENIEENLNNNEENIGNESFTNIKEETEIINFIKNSIKDYYENYSDDFIENIYILKTYELDTKFLKDIEDELLVTVKVKEIDILDNINLLARKDIDV
jgi:hypothetical protein